ncbi:hypothetical protein [Microvirga sp. BSC39]|jgi:hypothetical protein|uniref:hypothetical protein n=1 Tax=Microvirga sp. BSC39 TaxID=1549810 RepID=UPI0004E909FE|nr:hypothetical protein [Microvirga sp. BSC39]KFG70816.1 hypothetical protein JH26_01860 [Microvirga sp. BSC39]
MRVAVAVIAALLPGISAAQSDVWSLTVLERYASWVRDSGFACPVATRVIEVVPDDRGTAFKVICAPAGSAVTGQEVAYRVTLRPNSSGLVEPWQE